MILFSVRPELVEGPICLDQKKKEQPFDKLRANGEAVSRSPSRGVQ